MNAQNNWAGPDKLLCLGASVQIGQNYPGCTPDKCCYTWEPAHLLDNPQSATPTTVALSTSMTFSVTVSDCNGNFYTDQVNVQTYKVDFTVHKPKVLDETESIVADDEGQTFVNIDNDDKDNKLDDVDDSVAGGDDELVKIDLQLTFLGLPPSNVPKIALVKHASSVGNGCDFWLNKEKSGTKYSLGFDLTFTGSNGLFKSTIYAEGVKASTVQKENVYALKLIEPGAVPCLDNKTFAITVIGFESLEWKGIQNGYTGGDGKNNSDVLDYINNSHRVFPEGKSSNYSFDIDPPVTISLAKDKVIFRTNLTVKPVWEITLYIKPMDLDDPAIYDEYLDPNDQVIVGNRIWHEYFGIPSKNMLFCGHNDNRHPDNLTKMGKLINAPSSPSIPLLKSSYFNSAGSDVHYEITKISTKSFDYHFIVSHQPGDNYILGVYVDEDYVKYFRNLDHHDQEKVVAQYDFSSSGSVGASNDIYPELLSKPLTVWRTLHIEYDRMRNPTQQDNMFKGWFSGFEGTFDKVTKITGITRDVTFPECQNYDTDKNKPLKDGSDMNNGRFENGRTLLGNSSTSPLTTIEIEKNGENSVTFKNQTDLSIGGTLPSILQKGSLTLNSTIYEIAYDPLTSNTIVYLNTLSDLSPFIGGNLSIGGGPFSGLITSVDNSSGSIKLSKTSSGAPLQIPIYLQDDDDIPATGQSSQITPLDFNIVKTEFANSYVDAVVDGGVFSGFNDANIEFYANLGKNPNATPYSKGILKELSAPTIRKSWRYEFNHYWIDHVVSSWQYATAEDNDPNSENAALGIAHSMKPTYPYLAHCELAIGGESVFVFHESSRNLNIEQTLLHEIGHSLGFTHGHSSAPIDPSNPKSLGTGGNCAVCYSPTCKIHGAGVMSTLFTVGTRPNNFLKLHKHFIRSREKSPGQN